METVKKINGSQGLVEGSRNRKADVDTEGSGGKVHPPGATWAEQLWAGQVP